jgi:hypothetical protein
MPDVSSHCYIRRTSSRIGINSSLLVHDAIIISFMVLTPCSAIPFVWKSDTDRTKLFSEVNALNTSTFYVSLAKNCLELGEYRIYKLEQHIQKRKCYDISSEQNMQDESRLCHIATCTSVDKASSKI